MDREILKTYHVSESFAVLSRGGDALSSGEKVLFGYHCDIVLIKKLIPILDVTHKRIHFSFGLFAYVKYIAYDAKTTTARK